MKKINLAVIFLSLLVPTSCSVAMASKKSGTSVEKVQQAVTRSQMLACGATVVSTERSPSGQLIETYQFQKEQGSSARAVLHGLLDIGTFGLWEVAGTPIEGSMDQKQYFIVKAYYDDNERVQKLELN